jgi:hypothetical protein
MSKQLLRDHVNYNPSMPIVHIVSPTPCSPLCYHTVRHQLHIPTRMELTYLLPRCRADSRQLPFQDSPDYCDASTLEPDDTAITRPLTYDSLNIQIITKL